MRQLDAIFEQQREHAMTVRCEYCRAEPGERCRNPKSGHLIEHQAAHHVRLNTPTPPTTEATQ